MAEKQSGDISENDSKIKMEVGFGDIDFDIKQGEILTVDFEF